MNNEYVTGTKYRPVWIDAFGLTQSGKLTTLLDAISKAKTLRKIVIEVWIEDDEHNRIDEQ
jgi:hypothetical protein